MSRSYLVTGGTSGIGRAVAEHLHGEGHAVWITGTREESVAAALDAGVATGGSACDVGVGDAVDAAFAEAAGELGVLDGVFANAGVDGQGAPASTLSPEGMLRVLDVNVVGVLRTAQAAYRHLCRPGQIVVNASVNALRPEAGFADYNAGKAAAVSVSTSLALEWSAEGIGVIALCPGYFPSRMTQSYLDDPVTSRELLAAIPAGRFGTPGDIGPLVAFLLGPHAGYLTGAVVPVAGARNV